MSDSEEYDEVQIDLNFCDTSETHFHSISSLLKVLFGTIDSKHVPNISYLANQIVETSPWIGDVIEIDDEESRGEAAAFITLLPCSDESVSPIINYINHYRPVSGSNEHFKQLDSQNLAWLLCERIVNLPCHVAPPLYRFLVQEVEWAVKTEKYRDIKYFFIISKVYKTVESKVDEEEDEEPEGKKLKVSDEDSKNSKFQKCKKLVHVQDEEELFEKFCEFSFVIQPQLSSSSDAVRVFGDYGILHQRKIMVFKIESLKAMKDLLETEINEE